MLCEARSPVSDSKRSVFFRIVWTLMAVSLVGCAGQGKLRTPWTPAWDLPPPPVKLAPVVRPGALIRAELENGLQIIVLEDHRLPLVNISLSVRRGSGAVDPELAGLAEFTSELMNRGAGDWDALTLAQQVDDIGASLFIGSDWDSMNVTVRGLSTDMDRLLEIFDSVTRDPRFDPAEAEKTRNEQLAGLEAKKDSPGTLVQWKAMAAIYPSHRYGVPRSGTPESVARLDEKVARALHESYFVPNNAVLSISGDVDASAFIARMRKVLADWSPSDVPEQTPPPPIEALATPRIVIVDEPDLVQARIVITHEGIARTDPRRVAAGLMNDTLGGSGFSSRMMKTLRSNEGLTYGVGSGFALRRQPGPFIVSTFTRVAETRRAVNILLGEIEGIRGDHAQTADELMKAKSYNVGQFGLGLETSAAVLDALVDLELHGLPENSLDTYRARVDAVTLEEVDEIARALLHPDRAAIVLLGPAADLVPQFEDLGEIQVVEP
jgi:zinc protease